MTHKIGFVLLGILLIAGGLVHLIPALSAQGVVFALALVAIVTGILILVDR